MFNGVGRLFAGVACLKAAATPKCFVWGAKFLSGDKSICSEAVVVASGQQDRFHCCQIIWLPGGSSSSCIVLLKFGWHCLLGQVTCCCCLCGIIISGWWHCHDYNNNN